MQKTKILIDMGNIFVNSVMKEYNFLGVQRRE